MKTFLQYIATVFIILFVVAAIIGYGYVVSLLFPDPYKGLFTPMAMIVIPFILIGIIVLIDYWKSAIFD